MDEVKTTVTEKEVRIELSGRVDSNNAADVEKELLKPEVTEKGLPVVIDAEGLTYISSAGLRVLLHLRKSCPDMKITGVQSVVYETLEMTGFTEMMTVEKAYRNVSVEGCEVIGKGANGTIYRIDQDNVVKVYNNPEALEDIRKEREVARTALILGIPTAISYDVVKVGDSYGSVFELLNAKSFSKILAGEPEKFDWCVDEFVGMLKKIHSTEVPEGKLPDSRETAIGWAKFLLDYLPEEYGKKLVAMTEEIPQDNHMIHGDYHTNNLELQGDEVLLIDMDTLATGHPIIELASIFNGLIGFGECDKDQTMSFLGISNETAQKFFDAFLAKYLGTDNAAKLKEVKDKARILGYTRLIRRSIRRGGLEDEQKKAEIEHWKKELMELLDMYGTLLFYDSELVIEAETKNLPLLLSFIEERLEKIDCPIKAQTQISVAAEEIFVNISQYAYAPEKGLAAIKVEVLDDPVTVSLTFMDHGIPFDPLAKADPDVKAPAEERQIGGLGIFMTKKLMDDVSYEYKDGHNILRLKKKI